MKTERREKNYTSHRQSRR